jgi:hypothetical protein
MLLVLVKAVVITGKKGASTFGRNIILLLQKTYYTVDLKKSIRRKWMLPVKMSVSMLEKLLSAHQAVLTSLQKTG